ncbi:hypothetical protein ATE80_27160 [Streptomyces kanasensis]|uniref:Uncharacterized protein n=1 Tax=Streptomyces kanasensis TaxID=936756 RepID=A0A124EBW8_9ACTN|nr:hypothetical protein ATE80_27160 [Streptomyces kanasensis]
MDCTVRAHSRCSSRMVSRVARVSPWSSGSGMAFSTKRMMLRAMPSTAVVGESRVQSRRADSKMHPTSSRAKESA